MRVMLLLGDDFVLDDEVELADEMVDEGLPNLLRPTDELEVVEGCGEVEAEAAAGTCRGVVLMAVTVLAPDSST